MAECERWRRVRVKISVRVFIGERVRVSESHGFNLTVERIICVISKFSINYERAR